MTSNLTETVANVLGTALAVALTLWGRVIMRRYEHLLEDEDNAKGSDDAAAAGE